MNVIIVGAGELGQLIALKLSSLRHDVVLVDSSSRELENAAQTLDTRMVLGCGTSVQTLKDAGAPDADLLLALSGDEATNILACAMARQLGTRKTICRTLSPETFSESDGITPGSFHIDHVFSPVEECVEMIHGILQNRILLQEITFQNPDAMLDVVNVPLNSALTGVQIKDLPCPELLRTIRLAAVIRKRVLVVPHGDTILQPGDRLYIAGRKDNVTAFVEWLSRDGSTPIRRVVVAGISPVSEALIPRLVQEGIDIRVIDSNSQNAERLLNSLPKEIMLLQGEGTNMELLSEAEVSSCDAFAALSVQDENNILACLLASHLGARKVIALTGTAEYMDILPSIEQAGCWFNTTQIAANAVFRLMSQGTLRLDPELRAIHARMAEFTLDSHSRHVGKSLQECRLPKSFLIAMILRGNSVVSPTGQTVLQSGDQLIVIANEEDLSKMQDSL